MAERPPSIIGDRAPGRYGAHGTGVTLREIAIPTAWNVQGDIGNPALIAAAQGAFGVALPPVANSTARGGDWTALWLGPRSWLLVAAASLASSSAPAFITTRDALNAAGGALFDVSASRVAFAVSGGKAATVLTKSCPLDLHPGVFPVGTCAQSLSGHVPALFYMPEDGPTFVVMVARSLAGDAWRTLCLSAQAYGYEVAPRIGFGDRWLPDAPRTAAATEGGTLA